MTQVFRNFYRWLSERWNNSQKYTSFGVLFQGYCSGLLLAAIAVFLIPGILGTIHSSVLKAMYRTTQQNIDSRGFIFPGYVRTCSDSWIGGSAALIRGMTFQRRYRRANRRACQANMKTLAGAIEMFNLDYNAQVGKSVREYLLKHAENATGLESEPELFYLFSERLVKEGYLQSIPQDPGSDCSSKNYLLITSGSSWEETDIFCTCHGFIQPPEGCSYTAPPLDQLLSVGITDGEVTKHASSNPVRSGSSSHKAGVVTGILRAISIFSLLLYPLVFLLSAVFFSYSGFRTAFFCGVAAILAVSSDFVIGSNVQYTWISFYMDILFSLVYISLFIGWTKSSFSGMQQWWKMRTPESLSPIGKAPSLV